MYVETAVARNQVQAMVDIVADTVYTVKELADRISLLYKEGKRYMKGLNVIGLPIYGVGRGTDIRVQLWRDLADTSATSLPRHG